VAVTVRSVRVRPAIRRLAWWILPVLTFIAAWQVWDAIEAGRVERALIRVRADDRGEPRESQAPSIDNAARYYAAAAMAAVGQSGNTRVQTSPGGPLRDALEIMRDAMSRGTDAPALVLEAAAQQTQHDDIVIELLGRGSGLPFAGFAPGTDFNYRFSGLYAVNRSASLRTLELIRSGDGDGATRVLVDRALLLRAFDQSQGLIASASKAALVKDMATDVGILAGSLPSGDSLRELSRALQSVYASDEFERGIRAEILRRHQLVQSLLGTRGSMAAVVLRPLIRHQFMVQLQTAMDALDRARLPWPERIRQLSELTDRRPLVPGLLRFIGFWDAPELTQRTAEAVAAWRCARLVVAVEQFRRDHGRLPETLTELEVAGGQEEVSDPFTGRSLHYVPENDVYVIYSVGRNLQDENGTLTPQIPIGRVPSTVPRPDVGVRVPTRRSSA
jgi:hypothetical protein